MTDPLEPQRTHTHRLGKRVGEPMLTIFMLAPIAAYSSEVQQPVRAIAAPDKHPRTRQAAPSGREKGRAGNLHPDAQLRPIMDRVERGQPNEDDRCRVEPCLVKAPPLRGPLARRQRRALPCEASAGPHPRGMQIKMAHMSPYRRSGQPLASLPLVQFAATAARPPCGRSLRSACGRRPVKPTTARTVRARSSPS